MKIVEKLLRAGEGRILKKLPRKPYEIAFPTKVELFLKTVRSMPRAISFPLIRWFTKTLQ